MTDRLDAFAVTLSEFVRRNSCRLTISAMRTNVMPGTHCLNLQWVNRRIVRPSGIPFGQFRTFVLAHLGVVPTAWPEAT
jgi:hypothetical protein